MSSNTKAFEDKMKSAVEHLERELKTVRAGRANPGVLDKVTVDYYGSPTPIQQVASVAVSEARTLTITPWDRTLLRAISKAILASDVGINPIDDGQTIRPGSHRGAPQAAGQGSLQDGRGGKGRRPQRPP
jgi:ribosome recycling factor